MASILNLQLFSTLECVYSFSQCRQALEGTLIDEGNYYHN